MTDGGYPDDGPDACPLAALCDRVGVDPGTGEVVDPADVE